MAFSPSLFLSTPSQTLGNHLIILKKRDIESLVERDADVMAITTVDVLIIGAGPAGYVRSLLI